MTKHTNGVSRWATANYGWLDAVLPERTRGRLTVANRVVIELLIAAALGMSVYFLASNVGGMSYLSSKQAFQIACVLPLGIILWRPFNAVCRQMLMVAPTYRKTSAVVAVCMLAALAGAALFLPVICFQLLYDDYVALYSPHDFVSILYWFPVILIAGVRMFLREIENDRPGISDV